LRRKSFFARKWKAGQGKMRGEGSSARRFSIEIAIKKGGSTNNMRTENGGRAPKTQLMRQGSVVNPEKRGDRGFRRKQEQADQVDQKKGTGELAGTAPTKGGENNQECFEKRKCERKQGKPEQKTRRKELAARKRAGMVLWARHPS